jgi:hypothetical protein
MLLALPAFAHAASVSVRIEAASAQLVPRTDVTLPTGPVTPIGAGVGQTCPGDSVIGVLNAATGGDWWGKWSAADGWSIERIKTVTVTVSDPPISGQHWVAYVNNSYVNDPPCHATVPPDATVLLYPACGTASSQCFAGEPLQISTLAIAAPGVRLGVQVWELNTSFYNALGTTSRGPSINATVTGPNGSATTDSYYAFGTATVTLTERGPNLVTVAKGNRVPDRATVCVTDGNDGYCGSPAPVPVPFDPYAFCQTTGDDGLCGTLDKRPPVGHINQPIQAKTYASKSSPRFLKGTVDHDPSEVAQVKLRLVRQSRVTGTKIVKKKVTVKRRVHGKLVRKRVVKKVRVKVRVTACFAWNSTKSSWTRLRSCKVVPAQWFKADGDEVWSYEFLEALPGGRYTLDAQAFDGAGNVDSAPEIGRNRATFTVG